MKSALRLLLATNFLLLGPLALPYLKAAELASTIELTHEGQAKLPIVISPQASAETGEQAKELAGYLKRITGADFEIEAKVSGPGIYFGTDAEWPGHLPPPPEGRSPLLIREDYLLKTEKDAFYLIGRTAIGVQDAVWDLLQGLGFRQYFPGPDWEIWPHEKNLSISLNSFQSPDYFGRRIFLGGGTWPENREAFQQWCERNRMISGFVLNTGHAYGYIISRNKKVFDEHPEYIFSNEKLDSSNPAVRSLVAADSLQQLESDPEMDCIKLDPSDGAGWPEKVPLGSPSNQVATLANYVAKAIQGKFPGRKVGIYAYGFHSPPPDIEVDPNVIVSVATNYIANGYKVEELMDGWHRKGAVIGIREYLSVWPWENDQPGRSRASSLDYIEKTIPNFYKLGARYWTTEASAGWAVNGLGTYLASQLLWDVRKAADSNAILDDFYHRAFAAAAPEMKTFFEHYILAAGHPLVSSDLLGRMYGTLGEALAKSDSSSVTTRILDLVIYTRFVELMMKYSNAADKKSAYAAVARFAYQTRASNMVNSLAAFNNAPIYPKGSPPAELLAQKVDTLITDEELKGFVKQGIVDNPKCSFNTISFSKDLIPLGEPPEKSNGTSVTLRGTNNLYLYAASSGTGFDFQITGAITYGTRGPVKLRLYAKNNPIEDEAVASVDVPADKLPHSVHLDTPFAGLHRLEISDGHDSTAVEWPEGQQVVLPASPEDKTENSVRGYDMVFYVPKGTQVVGGYSKLPKGRIQLPDGTCVLDLKGEKGAGYFSVNVPPGADGTVWKFSGAVGEKLLLTVPPYLARSSAELLVPKETVESKGDQNEAKPKTETP